MHLDDESLAGREPSGDHRPVFQAVSSNPTPLSPAQAPPSRRPSRRKWLYIAAILLLGMVTAEPQAAGLAERRGEALGGGIALLFTSFALVSVFYVWRTSTRPLIPGAALIAALLMVPVMRIGDAQETEEQFAALQRLAEDSTSSPVSTVDAPPRTSDARMLWATRKATEDLLAHHGALARSHGFDPDNPPDVWLSAAYLANARKHPEVGLYFTRYQAYVREADSTLIPVLTEQMRARLLESGLSRPQIDGFMRGFDRGAAQSAQRQTFASMLELTEQALQLDAYLVRVDPRVSLDAQAETALFDREAERLHVGDLLERIERLGRAVEAQERRGRGSLRELGRAYGIEGDTAEAPATETDPTAPTDVRKT